MLQKARAEEVGQLKVIYIKVSRPLAVNAYEGRKFPCVVGERRFHHAGPFLGASRWAEYRVHCDFHPKDVLEQCSKRDGTQGITTELSKARNLLDVDVVYAERS